MSVPFSDSARDTLIKAGWTPDRAAIREVAAWEDALVRNGRFRIFPAARQALTRFGGLKVHVCGPGVDQARIAFILDPLRATDAEPIFERYSALLGTQLFPLGEAGDQAFLAIAQNGAVYLLFEGALLIGNTVEAALESLIDGRASPDSRWVTE